MSVWATGVWATGVWADGVWFEDAPAVCLWEHGVWAEGVWADGVWYCSGSAPVAPTITTTTLSDGQVGVAYSATLVATGTAPITWAVTVGTLPDGLSLDANTGAITGTPTTEIVAGFTVEATNAAGSDTQAYTLTIAAAAATTGIVGPGGAGYPVYWQGKRRKRRLEDQPNLHLKKVLDDVVNELSG